MNTRVHISIPTRNLEKSLQFYRRLFDTPPSKVRDRYANFRLDEPAIHLALVEQEREQSTGHSPHGPSHFGVELKDREMFDRWRERFEREGLAGRDEKDVVCCYARAEKVWFNDPDGHAWEIWVRTADADRM